MNLSHPAPHGAPRSPTGWHALSAGAVLALLLMACGDNTRGSSTPAAMEPPRGSGTGETEPRTVTPAAADTPAGGSAGHRGITPVPDASGGPPGGSGTGQGAAGAAPSRPHPGATSTPQPGATPSARDFTQRPGLPAEALGRSSTQGSTNSTPNSSTGNASR